MGLLIAAVGYIALSARAPRSFTLQTSSLDEASGLACSQINKGILWSQNDSGGKAAVFALDTQGRLVCRLELVGVKNRDWEELAVARDPKTGKSHIYIGEIGDNNARYESVKIYKVEEPVLSPGDTLLSAKDFETYEVTYADGARDAEAMFVEPASGDIYIISKREEQVGLYRIAAPSAAKKNIAIRISSLPLAWVTAADLSPNGKKLLVKTYTGVFRFKSKLAKNGELLLSKRPKALPYKVEPQGEGICWDAKGKGYYTLSEAAEDTPQVLYYYK